MVLVDTSVWIDHLRRSNGRLSHYLTRNDVLGHPFVTGEIGLGNLANRPALLRDLARLPQAKVAHHVEVDALIEQHRLFGRGLGYVDCHLLTATLLTPHCLLWTMDKRLAAAAAEDFSVSDARLLQ